VIAPIACNSFPRVWPKTRPDSLCTTPRHSIAAGKTEASNDITVADVYKLSKDRAMRSWQRKWNEDSVGRFTYSLIPEVGSKVIYPKKREVGVSYCRILLHDTMLNDDAFRTGIADTPICECGQQMKLWSMCCYDVLDMLKPEES